MTQNPFREKFRRAQNEGRRLVVPLVGFPGLNMTGCTIKLAQQNYGEHFKVMKAIAEAFEPDVIFPLMDLAVEANALGRYTVFPQAESATVVQGEFSVDELTQRAQVNIAFDTRLLGYVETMKLMCIGLPDSILKGAYVTGPYTLAALMMGAGEAAMATVLKPDELHAVCQYATERIQEYARLLIAAGAQVLCVLEPSAVMLGPEQFGAFSANYIRHIIESCKYTGVATVYHTCGNTMHLLDQMAGAGVSAVSLDSPVAGVDLPAVAQKLPEDVAVMGNINPTGCMLTGKSQDVEAEVTNLLKKMAPYSNFILSTGCDLPQETPLENIHAFMRAGRRYRAS
ncbi:uroporphyrinogen decarboxylase family protein [Candidatus Sumerlaeota bacterium]|nr:uroporphyrinogen decarboxylase family protein [Candidatus Sumerlaeota bacterium]